jgi:ElaB/YqjD/DUF883 family membrane-anchored ribosome-binding protein
MSKVPTSSDSPKVKESAAHVAQLKDDLANVINEAKSLLSDIAGNAAQKQSHRTRELYAQGVDRFREGMDAASSQAAHFSDAAGTQVRKHPLTALGITLGAGLILGSLLSLTHRNSH